jgi:hypothetical protein
MLGFIPMPHEVSIEKASTTLDEWGYAVAESQPVKVKAKISYNSANESISIASGEMVRYTAQILLEGVPDIDYLDFVTWTDSKGRVHRKQPLEIDYKHDLSGNPIAVRITV